VSFSRAGNSSSARRAIYVTPRLVSPDSGRVQELIRDGHKMYQDAAARVAFSLFD